jgi:hypothetical protein
MSELVDDLRAFADIIDESKDKAVVTMLSGSIFSEAAEAIERLTIALEAVRCERDMWEREARRG